VNRLQDLDYRVQTLTSPEEMPAVAQKEKPLLVILAMEEKADVCCAAIKALRDQADTAHIPLLAIGTQKAVALQKAACEAGANLVASDNAILAQLPQLLDQILRVE